MKNLLFILGVFFLIACEDTHENPEIIVETETTIEGHWVLYERGYSPGVGYIVEKVNDNPSSKITLTFEKEFSSNIKGLEQFKYYRVVMDSALDTQILALYKTNPGTIEPDVKSLEHSYYIELQEDDLKLSFRYCIEGCHMSFKRLVLND